MAPLVLKFGGASVATPENFELIAEIILKRFQKVKKLVVVVSAMGKMTDELLTLAKKVHPDPPRREVDMLISVGERISISLLAMALAKKNLSAISFTGSQSGIITSSSHTEARILEVRPKRILASLEQGKIVIVAGFQGMSVDGDITTLGRGGSDLTAVALAAAISASHVEFYKDIDGIFSEDPKKDLNASIFPELGFDEARSITQKGAKVLLTRSIDLAKRNSIPLHVLSFSKFCEENFEKSGTWIGKDILKKPASPLYEYIEEVVHDPTSRRT